MVEQVKEKDIGNEDMQDEKEDKEKLEVDQEESKDD